MLNMPILSIIVPSYNMEKYLPKCLGSLIVAPEQMEKLEVLVVNDGSKDRTSEIAHEFAAKWPGTFKVIDKENGHYGSCINAGLEVATGAYVRVLDADDWFVTENFSEYLEFLVRTADRAPDLVVSDFEFINGEKRIAKCYGFVGECGFDVSRFDYKQGRDPWMHAIAYKTENIRKMGYRQLGGITHTDVQWLNLPMTSVRTTGYFPKTVYAYNVVREGNTSDDVGYYRTFHDLVTVTKKIIAECNQTADAVDATHAKYLRQHAYYRAMRVYFVCLCKRSPLLRSGIVKEFDDFLAANAKWLYDALDGEVVGCRFRFHYVRDWRRHKRVSIKLRLFLKLQKIYGDIRGALT